MVETILEPMLLADGRSVVIRPVTPQDEPAERAFFARLSPRTRRLRFHNWSSGMSDRLIHFYTHVDQDKHVAFICQHEGSIVGDARCVAHPAAASCEFWYEGAKTVRTYGPIGRTSEIVPRK